MAITKPTFKLSYEDKHGGTSQWDILLPNGAEVGQIEKSSVWGGDGYVADCYSVRLDHCAYEDGLEQAFHVAEYGHDARKAATAARRWAREMITKAEAEAPEPAPKLVKPEPRKSTANATQLNLID